MTRYLKANNKLAITFVAGLLVTSCASFQPIEPRYSNIQQQVQIGDTVRVITRDGRKQTIKVSDVTLEALYGEGPNIFDDGKVLLNDISSVEKKKDRKYANSPLIVYGAIGLGFLILHDRNKDGDLVFGNN
jgi:hypothetical protein